MKKRKDKRVNKCLLVNISRNGMEQLGVTVNVSRWGMCIATTEIFPVRSKFQILLAAADDIYALSGLVVWNSQKAGPVEDNVTAGLGIRIEKSDRGYIRYISEMSANHSVPFGH